MRQPYIESDTALSGFVYAICMLHGLVKFKKFKISCFNNILERLF